MKAKVVLLILISVAIVIATASLILKDNGNSLSGEESMQSVYNSAPLRSEEDTIELFFQLINNKEIDKALEMMVSQDGQDWRPYLEGFLRVLTVNIDRTESDVFRVDLDVEMKPETADRPIPFFGYTEGLNTKFIILSNEDGIWKIKDIATGP